MIPRLIAATSSVILILCAPGRAAVPASSPIVARAPAASASDDALGALTWGLATLSVCSAREQPAHAAEMGTQLSLGHAARLLKRANGWIQVEDRNGYRAWVEAGAVVRCSADQIKEWENGPLVVVTAIESVVVSRPERQAEPVADVVIGNRLKVVGREGDWLRVALPDGRTGYLEHGTAEDDATWRKTRRATPANIEATARRFIGRPYLWGGNSSKGLDCSGFTQLVFALNGIDLPHNASRQSSLGSPVALPPEQAQLRLGDLLFFGHAAAADLPAKITHVGIYLGDGLIIHSLDRVRIDRLSELTARPGRLPLLQARRLLD
jgi:cell wall-associated NlpC family hydrolase